MNTWQSPPQACGCNQVGSVTQQCNPNTGCCMCRDQFQGEKCSECKLGYRDFPQCISCECNVAGSDSQTCDADQDVCACADRTGQCSCKVTHNHQLIAVYSIYYLYTLLLSPKIFITGCCVKWLHQTSPNKWQQETTMKFSQKKPKPALLAPPWCLASTDLSK